MPTIAKIEISLDDQGKTHVSVYGPPIDQAMLWYGMLEIGKDAKRALGAGGTWDTQGKALFETASVTAVTVATPNTAAATVSTTVDEFLSVSATFSTASANDSITARQFVTAVQ